MHPFYYIGPKIMFGSVSEHFANLRLIKKDAILVFRSWMHYFEVSKFRIVFQWLAMYYVSMWLVVNKVWDTSESVSGLNTCIQYSVMCWCYLKQGTISTISLECYFSLIHTKLCNPCTRRVHSVYTAHTLNEGRTNDYRLAFRTTLSCDASILLW
jgi:hypothetical protein